jgi:hypothetical protein
MGEEAATEGSEDEELLNELPEGDDGWEYIEGATETETEVSEKTEEGDEETQGEKEDVQDGDEGSPASVRELERAVRDGDEYGVEQAFAEAEFEVTKGDVAAFVRKTEEDVTKTAFVPGDVWGKGDSLFSELGWVEGGELTAVGASVLAYAGDVIDGARDDAVLVGYLNSVGVDVFLREAVIHGPDDEEDEDGVIGGFLG